MKEIRFHGRGGQGVVKSAQILVKSVIETGEYAHFIPFFGVERKGSPVYGFARIDSQSIDIKSQVYEPDCLVIMDDSLLDQIDVFEGLRNNSYVVINSRKSVEELNLPESAQNIGMKIGIIDATETALNVIGKGIPNTTMLGAFVSVTSWVDKSTVENNILKQFGEENARAAQKAYEEVKIYEC
ncbi:MAG: 2-oxoacid:acceptor oxidoreductase family protein [Clostridiales bacterium]|nr:2-oxoacid:acceptor oxidoreductase family protein [Clostridiales bacterium]MCF8022043.1 2-oxoacid:acceptor oxidoreductase family protein [Clostridiales bacterium]